MPSSQGELEVKSSGTELPSNDFNPESYVSFVELGVEALLEGLKSFDLSPGVINFYRTLYEQSLHVGLSRISDLGLLAALLLREYDVLSEMRKAAESSDSVLDVLQLWSATSDARIKSQLAELEARFMPSPVIESASKIANSESHPVAVVRKKRGIISLILSLLPTGKMQGVRT